MSQLDSVLLIDDNDADNYIHKRVLTRAGVVKEVYVAFDGVEALELLTTERDGAYLSPDLILLDINMPRMDGWEFLDQYDKLEQAMRGDRVIIMLSTSTNPHDIEKATSKEIVGGFLEKPLTEEALKEILAKHFPGRF